MFPNGFLVVFQIEVGEGYFPAQQLILRVLGEITLCNADRILRSPNCVVRIRKLKNDSWCVRPFLISGFEKTERSLGVSNAVVKQSPIDFVGYGTRLIFLVLHPFGPLTQLELC